MEQDLAFQAIPFCPNLTLTQPSAPHGSISPTSRRSARRRSVTQYFEDAMSFKAQKEQRLIKMQKDHACEYKKSTKLQNALEVSRRSWSLVNNGKTVDEVRAELKERS